MLTSTTLRCSRNNKWVIKHVNHTSLPQSKKRVGNRFSDGYLFLGLNPARFYIIIHTRLIRPIAIIYGASSTSFKMKMNLHVKKKEGTELLAWGFTWVVAHAKEALKRTDRDRRESKVKEKKKKTTQDKGKKERQCPVE